MVCKSPLTIRDRASRIRVCYGTFLGDAHVYYQCFATNRYESSWAAVSFRFIAWKGRDLKNFLMIRLINWIILFFLKEKRDLITGLKTRTNAGRPNWDKVFKQLLDQKKGKITVFYCGPPQLGRSLRLKCDQYGFNFRKEVF